MLDLLYGNYTFVNPVLAKHYGMPAVNGDADTWVRVDNAGKYGRGGLLPMAVFLTQNSPGLRTSPVKRGNWVVQRVLGESFRRRRRWCRNCRATNRSPICRSATCWPSIARIRSAPPATHASIPSAWRLKAMARWASARTKDLAGRPVDTSVTFPGGVQGTGLAGLQTFIREHRQNDFVDNLSRKLLAYALNRSLQLSDEALIERMETRLAAKEYRFGSLVETIVTSPQFLNKRVPDSRETSASTIQEE